MPWCERRRHEAGSRPPANLWGAGNAVPTSAIMGGSATVTAETRGREHYAFTGQQVFFYAGGNSLQQCKVTGALASAFWSVRDKRSDRTDG